MFGSGSLISHRLRPQRLKRLAYRINPAPFVRKVKLEKLLMGGDLYSGLTFARVSGDLLTPSTPVTSSPHAQFLRGYRELGDAIFEPDRFATTSYCKHALKCIELYGRFFSFTNANGILERARQFARMFEGLPSSADPCQSRPGAPVEVRRIKYSDCYEVIDGLHRLAMAAVRGADEHPCAVLPGESALTPMQSLVMYSIWLTGESSLLQPIASPELRSWKVVRRCTDRFDLMIDWLDRNGISSGTFLDIGAAYGWFVSEMSKRNFHALGVEQDAALASVGRHAYGLDQRTILVQNLISFLRSAKQRCDVVCCLSILHNYIPGHFQISALEFMRLVDQITGSVLFFETGECHESWLKRSIGGWDATYIQNWLQENTSFSKIEILGTDHDSNGVLRKRYGRHLFACSRRK